MIYFLVCAALAGLGAVILAVDIPGGDKPLWACWACLALGVAGAAVFGIMIASPRPIVIVTTERIASQPALPAPWGKFDVRWSEIARVYPFRALGQRLLGFDLRDVAAFRARLPRWRSRIEAPNQALGFPAVSMTIAPLSIGDDELISRILAYYREHVEPIWGPPPEMKAP